MSIRHAHREVVFVPGRAVPLDRNAKARIAAYARAWSAAIARTRRSLTHAALRVLGALLWGFHNARTGSAPRAMALRSSGTARPGPNTNRHSTQEPSF
jgi:hypothetical protein